MCYNIYILKKEVICVVIEYTFEIKRNYHDFEFEVEQKKVEWVLGVLGIATDRELARMEYDEFLDLCEQHMDELAKWFREEAWEECYDMYASPEELYGV